MIRTCAACGQRNRIPSRHLAETGRCGACKGALPPVAEPIDADVQTFDDVVREARVPVLVDFWASWCGPCRGVAPEVKHAAEELAGKAVVLKVDTERHPELAERFQVRAIPCFLVFKDGRIVTQQAGYATHRQMKQWLAR